MRNNSELGRNKFVMLQIINDSENDLEAELINLEQTPESFINVVYKTSYDEMSEPEKKQSIEWIKEMLTSNMR